MNDSKSSVRLFPNPSSGRFTIKGLPAEGSSTITLYDLTGREFRRVVTQGEQQCSFDVEDLPKGSYIVSILSDRLVAISVLVLN